jgi:hypothetical protein
MDKHIVNDERTNDPAANPDPITNAPGSHPIGTGIGAAAGGAAVIGGAIAAGAVAGSVVGPIGTAAGAAVGAIAGGLIGKGVAEGINPTREHDYWRSHYSSRPYAGPAASYEEFAPAYQYGWESRSRYPDQNFDQVEPDLSNDWFESRGASELDWERAKPAVRDAWNRVSPGT